MFFQAIGVAALGKPVLALGIIASAFGAAGSLDNVEHRTPNLPGRETATPQTTHSFEALLSECVARYKRSATNTKEACDLAIAASGLSADAFAAKYRSLLVPPAQKTEKPAPREDGDPKAHDHTEADDRADAQHSRPKGQGVRREVRGTQDTEDKRTRDFRSGAQRFQPDLQDRARVEGLSEAPPRVRALRSRLQLRAGGTTRR